MGLDNGYGAGIGSLKPGVCTSTTRPASPYDGQMIYETDTNLVRIWNGSAWKTLSYSDYTNGTILQTVNATYSTQTSVASSTYVDTGLSASITPISTSSKILITVAQNGMAKVGNVYCAVKILRNSTDITTIGPTLGNTQTTLTLVGFSVNATYLDSPSLTSSITYKTQFSSSGATAYTQTDGATSYITLQEIAG